MSVLQHQKKYSSARDQKESQQAFGDIGWLCMYHVLVCRHIPKETNTTSLPFPCSSSSYSYPIDQMKVYFFKSVSSKNFASEFSHFGPLVWNGIEWGLHVCQLSKDHVVVFT